MPDSSSSFGSSAAALARNPLGIIALFIVLVYGFASLVTAFSAAFVESERRPLIYFMVFFPVLVLLVFSWLVSRHHRKLYGPGDFKDESNFVVVARPELSQLAIVPPREVPEIEISDDLAEFAETSLKIAPVAIEEWALYRTNIYREARNIVLVHALQSSKSKNQLYDVFIYLKRHQGKDLSDVRSVEFFFGRHWGNRIIKANRSGDYIGVRTSAYGPFLCVCKVTFDDGVTSMLHRYIDFEMGLLSS